VDSTQVHLRKESNSMTTLERKNDLPGISVIIPTRDRPKDLANLLSTIIDQNRLPSEVIIVDDSTNGSTKTIFDFFSSKFESSCCTLKYLRSNREGLTTARNLGVINAKGEAILFMDDDTLLGNSVISTLTTFISDHPDAIAVQPELTLLKNENPFENALRKTFMLSYYDDGKLNVRRSGASIFPNRLKGVRNVQRLLGSAFLVKREVFRELSFDTNLMRSGDMEDLDFSYRLYRKNPKSLYAISNIKIVHSVSAGARLPKKSRVDMSTIYWFYIFFKDIFEGSIINLAAFVFSLIGNLVTLIGGLIVKRKSKKEWWNLIYLLVSYITAFRNLRNIVMKRLEFFNKSLRAQEG
jgi:glycosyltransferase involved in cell wall biosynthesis